MKKVRFAVCGAGRRGSSLAADVLCMLDTVEIIAICDLSREKAEALADTVKEKNGNTPAVYTDHRELLRSETPDAILIATSIETHATIAIDAMEKGVAVGMEVGGAGEEADCYRLVEAYERTKTPFMFLENCCYGEAELFAASLKKHGVLGEVVYCHGAYRHDIRELTCTGDGKGSNFRLDIALHENSDWYPTHELGPIAKMLNIGRGNRMVSLSSRASSAKGLSDYIARKEQFRDMRDLVFRQGDIVETLIQCENGELIHIHLDTTLPTFYSREISLRGTRGLYQQDGNIVMVEGDGFKRFQDALNSADRYKDQYLPEMWKTIPEEIKKTGHGGMDYLMLCAFVDALLCNKEMPIDVYDAATWMSIGYLTRESIAKGGASVEIPDFTKGAYPSRLPLDVIDL